MSAVGQNSAEHARHGEGSHAPPLSRVRPRGVRDPGRVHRLDQVEMNPAARALCLDNRTGERHEPESSRRMLAQPAGHLQLSIRAQPMSTRRGPLEQRCSAGQAVHRCIPRGRAGGSARAASGASRHVLDHGHAGVVGAGGGRLETQGARPEAHRERAALAAPPGHRHGTAVLLGQASHSGADPSPPCCDRGTAASRRSRRGQELGQCLPGRGSSKASRPPG
jgi:hypothetical protein